MRPALPRLHAITDERIARRPDLERLLDDLSRAGLELAAHARGHALSGLEHYELAVRLSARPSIRLFVNDRLDIALAAGAAGVQLSQEGLSPDEARRLSAEWWIGRSVHSVPEARAAQALGADYLLAGPVYHTATHPAAAPLGLEPLREITRLGVPVIAIGGVTPERVPALAGVGVHGVAAIRAIWDAADPAGAAGAMLEAVA
jgi:thiamine-phosphate diphosphorylase